jgi:hypothetical protein
MTDVGVGSGYKFPLTPLTCNYCGAVWDRVNPVVHTGTANQFSGHTDAEWEQWRIDQGIPDGQPYARWTPVAPPPGP